MRVTRHFIFLLVVLFAPWAHADMYKCTDPKSGAIEYKNVGDTKGCKKVVSDISVVSSQKSGGKSASKSPDGFPKVDAGTQRGRDDLRRKVLDDEIDAETKALAVAREALAAQEAIRNGDEKNFARVQERLLPFQDDVQRHQKNIDNLRREINNLK